MSIATVTPPECCPVCGAKRVSELLHTPRLLGYGYSCGIDWLIDGAKWDGNCEHSTAAALRTGATLHPTALETARAAVIEAAKLWAQSVAGDDLPVDPDVTLFNAVSAIVALERQP